MSRGAWEAAGDRIGTGRRTAYALAVFPLNIVHRSTIRALLPTGRASRSPNHRLGSSSGNTETDKYRVKLRTLERLGLIDRGREFIRIKDRGALLDHALADMPKAVTRAEMVNIAQAVETLEREIREAEQAAEMPGIVERRRRELIALQDLMRASPGGDNWSGVGSVRFVPRGQVL